MKIPFFNKTLATNTTAPAVDSKFKVAAPVTRKARDANKKGLT